MGAERKVINMTQDVPDSIKNDRLIGWIKAGFDYERRDRSSLRHINGAREAVVYFKKFSGLPPLRDYDEWLHAAPKVLELWAFETGRLP